MEYEILYLIGESQENNLESIKKEVEATISKYQGKFLEGEWIEQRRLAYPIQHEKRGTYIVRRFVLPDKDEKDELNKSTVNFIGDITRKLNLQEGLLRFIIVKAEELPPLENKSPESKFKKKNDSQSRQVRKSEQKISSKESVKSNDIVRKKDESLKSTSPDEKSEKKMEENAATDKDKADDSVKGSSKEEAEVVEKPKNKEPKEDAENKTSKEELSGGDQSSKDDIDKKLEEILNI